LQAVALFFKIDDRDNFKFFLTQILYDKALTQGLILKGSDGPFFLGDKTDTNTWIYK
jgi:hypothetical protein